MNRHPALPRTAAIALAVAVALAAVACSGPKIRHQEDRNSSLESGDASELEVRAGNGRVQIQPGTPGKVDLKAVVRAEAKTGQRARELAGATRIDTRRDPGKVRVIVEEAGGFGESVSVELVLMVPSGMRVKARTSNGEIHVSGLKSAVHLETDNGDVSASDVIEAAKVKTSNGRVRIEGTPQEVSARTSNGSVELKLGAALTKPSEVTTKNGSIDIEMGPAAGAELSAEVGNGSIQVDPALGNVPGAKEGRAQGKVGKGGASLAIKTSNGSVRLRPGR